MPRGPGHLAAASVATLALAGCGAQGTTGQAGVTTEEAVMTTEATTEQPVRIEATGEVDNGLAVTYTVRNDGDSPVLVARDRGHDQNSAAFGGKDDEGVWARVDGDVLVLSKELTALPEGTEEEAETTLAADLVEPGARLEGTAYLRRPVYLNHPDLATPAKPDQPLTTRPTQWRLCLTTAPPEGHRADVIGRLTPGQRLVCSEDQTLPAGALDG